MLNISKNIQKFWDIIVPEFGTKYNDIHIYVTKAKTNKFWDGDATKNNSKRTV